MEQLVVSELVVPCLFLRTGSLYVLVYPWYFAEDGQQLIVEVGTEELHFGHALPRGFFPKLALAVLVEGEQGTVAARNRAVKTVPKFVHLARGAGRQRVPNVHGVVSRVARSAASLKAIVGGYVPVREQVERIGVPTVAQHGVSRCHHALRVGKGLVLVNHRRRRIVKEIVAARERNAHCASRQYAIYLFHCCCRLMLEC